MTPSKRYLFIYGALLAPIACLIYLNALFLYGIGEIRPVETIAREQQQNHGLYGSATHRLPYRYMLEIFSVRQPEVVAIGSSRVLQLSQSMFTTGFANLGQTVNSLTEGRLLISDLIQRHQPQLVLFGLDYWWFSENAHRPAGNFIHHRDAGDTLSFDTAFLPTQWLLEGKIPPAEFLKGLVYPSWLRPFATYGMRAALYREGLMPDGSYSYLGIQLGLRRADDSRFADTLSRIAESRSFFQHCSNTNSERFADYEAILRTLRDAQIPVITFLIPFAPTVQNHMKAMNAAYGCIDLIRARLAAIALNNSDQGYFDLFDSAAHGSDDCEFVDGFHGGSATTVRMLLKMIERPSSPLAHMVNRDALERLLAASAGRTVLPEHPLLGREDREVDFLEIGCVRPFDTNEVRRGR